MTTYAELKSCIENHSTYLRYIAKGSTHGMCEDFSLDYSLAFREHGIDHVLLDSNDHAFLAVKTSDRGTLVFDPTFTQFLPNSPEKYFLDSPEALLTLLNKDGLDHPLLKYFPDWPAITGRTAFMGATLRAPYAPQDESSQAIQDYVANWIDALRALQPKSHMAILGVKRTSIDPSRPRE